MVIKVSELNPLNPILSYCTSIAEEGVATVQSIPARVTSIFREIFNSVDPCLLFLERGTSWLGHTVIILPISASILTVEASYDLLFSLVRYIWDTVVWIAGGNPANNNLSPEALSAARGFAVNRSRIAEIPQAVSMDLPLGSSVSLADLLTEHDRILGTPTVPVADYIKTIQRRWDLIGFIGFVGGKRGDNTSPIYFTNLERMLLNTILKLRNAEPGNKKACDALNGLAEAYHGCDPRKYKECKRHCERMSGCGGNNATERLDQHILHWLKGFKEDLITERYQASQFHVLNSACDQARDWGLGGDVVEHSDPYIDWGFFYSGLNFRYTLNKGYTPARIIDVIKTNLDDEDYNDLITPYFEEHAGTLPENYEHELFDRHGKLNHRGVAWLLCHRGFLSSRIQIM